MQVYIYIYKYKYLIIFLGICYWVQIVKQLWAYIRKNNLQDPNNKRRIICNDELRLVFETDCTDMFKMNKLLAKHIIPLEPTSNHVCLFGGYFKLNNYAVYLYVRLGGIYVMMNAFVGSQNNWVLRSKRWWIMRSLGPDPLCLLVLLLVLQYLKH